jgi:hypothetical protein
MPKMKYGKIRLTYSTELQAQMVMNVGKALFQDVDFTLTRNQNEGWEWYLWDVLVSNEDSAFGLEQISATLDAVSSGIHPFIKDDPRFKRTMKETEQEI